MKKTKIIVPALGMLLLSTAASVTGTVAWFSMSNYVTATNMNIQAKAEKGIVISNADTSVWKDTATAKFNSAIAVRPTSTVDGSTWCHSTSDDANSALNTIAAQEYSMLTDDIQVSTTNGAGYVDDNGHTGYDPAAVTGENGYEADSNYFLKNTFHIKSSAEALTKPIYVNNVTVTGVTSSGELDKALRVLIVSGSNSLVYAPVSGATLSYSVCEAVGQAKTAVSAIDPAAETDNDQHAGRDKTLLSSVSIPSYSSTGNGSTLQIDVYLYFEGEDAACKSANLVTTLDTLSVTVKFGTVQEFTHPA